jgi:hypothetical protein
MFSSLRTAAIGMAYTLMMGSRLLLLLIFALGMTITRLVERLVKRPESRIEGP